MDQPEDCSMDHRAAGIYKIAGPLLVGGVDYLIPRTALFHDRGLRTILNSRQRFEGYLEFRDQTCKLAATQLVSMIKSPTDLLLASKDDEELFAPYYAAYMAFHDQKTFLGDKGDGSLSVTIPSRYVGDVKLFKGRVMAALNHVRKYFAYRKGLLKNDFIKWNSDPEEVLRRLKTSTRWSSELDNHDLKRGLKSHMLLLKELELSKVNLSEFQKVAMHKINLELSSELENYLSRYDSLLMDQYFERMRYLNLARAIATQAQTTGIIFLDEALPIRAPWKEQMLSTTPNFWRMPYLKQTVKQTSEGSSSSLHEALAGSMVSLRRMNERFRARAADDSNTSGEKEELVVTYDPESGMSKEEFEWRASQYKMVDQCMPQVLNELQTNLKKMRCNFLDDPDAIAKWHVYESGVYAAFASKLKYSMYSPLQLPNSVLYKTLMKRKTRSKSLVSMLFEGLNRNRRVVGAGAVGLAGGIVLGLAVGPAWWNQSKHQGTREV